MPPPRFPLLGSTLAVALAPLAHGGGGSERAVLVVDPADPQSLYVANVYLDRRDVPRGNAIYLPAAAADWSTFVAENRRGFEGALDHQRLRDRADFVIVPPGAPFYLPASGLVSDPCAPVNRFAIASAFTLADEAALIAGGVAHSSPNHYAQAGWEGVAFDAEVPWLAGAPSAGGHRYRIGAMLGYTGENGNTLADVLELIERSAAADATHPGGTFYYVETTDAARSAPRDFAYPEAVAQMAAVGGAAEHLLAVLPVGEHDCLGVMTGWATPDVLGADYTLLPGAFGDHLTSFAGKFDTTSQTKMSEWIAKGASGTSGAVEEPCNYSGKFPHARIHVLYRQGLALGEAWLASMGFLPFQNLLYGDPLTAPWAEPPAVDVPGFPAGPVTGVVMIAPSASATAAGAGVDALELLVDGVLVERAGAGAAFALDTQTLAAGPHEVRVLAYDDTPARHVGRFAGTLTVAGPALTGTPGATVGDLATAFDVAVGLTGATFIEVRLVQGARVVAAGGPGTPSLRIYGQNVGAGPVRLHLEADLAGGGAARSAPIELDVAFSGAGSAPPVAHSFTRTLALGTAALVELPASYPDDPAFATTTILTPPGQATVVAPRGAPWAIVAPLPGATGLDSLTFEVTTPAGTSAPATVVFEYVPKPTFPTPDFFRLDAVEPAVLPTLAPGTAQTVTLHGAGFGPQTVVEVDGVPVTGVPKPTTFVSPGEIALDVPQVAHLGTVTIGVRDGELYDELAVPIAPPATPKLQMADGDPGAIVFHAQGVDALLAGTRGATHVLVASVLPEPSDLPGIVHLDLGAGFAFVALVGAFPIDAVQGWTAVHVPLPGLPPATTVYAQAVEVGAAFPFAESNRQEFLVLF
jgi:hypothetical protein